MSGGNALIHMRLGILLRDQGDLPGSVEQFTSATGLQPDYSDAWRERGIQEGRLTKNAKGEESLRRAILLNPNDFDALASLGGILRKTNRLEEAAQLYQKAVEYGRPPYTLMMALKFGADDRARTIEPGEAQLFLAPDAAGAARRSRRRYPVCMFDCASAVYAGDPRFVPYEEGLTPASIDGAATTAGYNC